MRDRENIEALLARAEAEETARINNLAKAGFEAFEKEEQALSPEQFLANQATTVFHDLAKLHSVERSARVGFLDVIFRRHDKIAHYFNRRVELSYVKPYEQPMISGEDGLITGIQRLLSDRHGPMQKIMQLNAEWDDDPDLPEFLHSKAKDALYFGLEPDSATTVDNHMFDSFWLVRSIHFKQTYSGYLVKDRLVDGPFYDIDVLRATRERIEDKNKTDSTNKKQEESLAWHIRVNASDHTLRDFVAIDDKGQPKDEIAVVGGEDLLVACGILQQARSEIAADLAFFAR